jgi:hypothetical protein
MEIGIISRASDGIETAIGGIYSGLIEPCHKAASKDDNEMGSECPEIIIELDKLPAGTQQIRVRVMP